MRCPWGLSDTELSHTWGSLARLNHPLWVHRYCCGNGGHVLIEQRVWCKDLILVRVLKEGVHLSHNFGQLKWSERQPNQKRKRSSYLEESEDRGCDAHI
jgi:hypothetical protein